MTHKRIVAIFVSILLLICAIALVFRFGVKHSNASEAFIRYFDLLNAKQYAEALPYHGSGFELLQTWNPDIDPNDQIDLLRHGCEFNGWNCLRVKSIMEQERLGPETYLAIVQFQNEDGTLFKRGPCCGATEEEMPTQTNFEYIVKQTGDVFQVMTEPVYTP